MDKREEVCDEAELKLSRESRVYTERIPRVCNVYLESSLRRLFRIADSHLKKRIGATLALRVAHDVNWGRKVLPIVAGIVSLAMPICVGIVTVPSIQAQS